VAVLGAVNGTPDSGRLLRNAAMLALGHRIQARAPVKGLLLIDA
jgi:hypothetical protein